MQRLNNVTTGTQPNPNLLFNLFAQDSFVLLNKTILSKLGCRTAVYLANLIDKYKYFYTYKKKHCKNGWFFLIEEQQQIQIGMSVFVIRKKKQKLITLGLLETKRMGMPAKVYYRLNTDLIIALITFLESLDVQLCSGLITSNVVTTELVAKLLQDYHYKETRGKESKKGTMLVGNERHTSYSEDSNYFDSMDSMENPSIKNNSNTGTGTKTKKHNKVIPSNFEEWYALYPRKKNKPAARKAFNKIATSTPIKNRPTLKKLIVMVKRHSQTEQWNRPDKKGIPYPATWLNKERWELSVQEVNEAFNLVKEIKADKANKNKIRGSHSKSADKLTISNTTVVA